MGLVFTAMKMMMRTGREILVVQSIVCARVGSLVRLGRGALSLDCGHGTSEGINLVAHGLWALIRGNAVDVLIFSCTDTLLL